MRLALNTLGAPEWDLDTICRRAREYGFDGIDFRGYLDAVDVTTRPEFTDDLEQTAERIDDAGVDVVTISTSILLCDPDEREANVERATRLAPIVDALDVEYLRVFGGGNLDAYSRAELCDVASETMAELRAVEGLESVTWMLETHDEWIDSRDVRQLIDRIDDPALRVLWDLGHTTRVTDESPSDTLDRIGEDVVYVHVKDAVYEPDHPDAMDGGWRYVLPGEGELPLSEGVAALEDRGFNGWIAFEHEKRWHPSLSDPDVAYPQFLRWMEECRSRST
jgi:sugar phosphate isomerase/epimerase